MKWEGLFEQLLLMAERGEGAEPSINLPLDYI
jgi:hypothetical protein